ncbi:GNAT family N-acetyltransferase [Paenibacillus filicis]|uniref:GNAT family N-acetyltransferase n=1 Tax=Paenibacillus filicis TaxID=669464 RepID=A0ABU9DVI9_9BACL
MTIEAIAVTSDEQLKQGLQIRMEVFVKEQQVPADLELDEFDASWDACRHYLLVDDGRAVAAARYRMYDEETAKLQRIAVLASHRGLGLGRTIIEAMEADIRQRGIGAVILDAQTQAEPFYAKLGYVTISEEPFLDAGIWHVRMKKTLI